MPSTESFTFSLVEYESVVHYVLSTQGRLIYLFLGLTKTFLCYLKSKHILNCQNIFFLFQTENLNIHFLQLADRMRHSVIYRLILEMSDVSLRIQLTRVKPQYRHSSINFKHCHLLLIKQNYIRINPVSTLQEYSYLIVSKEGISTQCSELNSDHRFCYHPNTRSPKRLAELSR